MSILENLTNPDYELADTYQQEVAENNRVIIRLCRRDLFGQNETLHRTVIEVFNDDEYRFFRVVARLAATMAEVDRHTPASIKKQVDYAIQAMLCHLPAQLASGHTRYEIIPPKTLALCQQHIENCAMAMTSFLPTGIWRDIHPVLIQTDQLYFTGERYAHDYR